MVSTGYGRVELEITILDENSRCCQLTAKSRWRLNFAQPPLEKSALAVIGDQRQRSCVALSRFFRGPSAAQQIGACSMQQVIVIEIAGGGERIDERERRLRAVHHRDRHGPVQR